MSDPTQTYYEANAEQFLQDTLTVDMTPLYERFLPHLAESGHILDAGCGPGRDARRSSIKASKSRPSMPVPRWQIWQNGTSGSRSR